MPPTDCHYDCDSRHCPFAQDANHPNRYVCLKCGIDRSLDRNLSWFWLIILGLVIFLAFQQQEKPQQRSNTQTYYEVKK